MCFLYIIMAPSFMAPSLASSSKNIDKSFYFSYDNEDRKSDRETDRDAEGESRSRKSC